MVVITVQVYAEARVHTIKVRNKKLFWVKMIDVQKGFGLKKMPDLVKKEICGIFETKSPIREQKKKYIRTESEITKKPADDLMVYGVKQCNDGVNRLEKEKQRQNFRFLLGFKEHDIITRITKGYI